MPNRKKGEQKQNFVNRCIPQVLDEGTAKNHKQAEAICHSMFDRQSEKPTGRTPMQGSSPRNSTTKS